MALYFAVPFLVYALTRITHTEPSTSKRLRKLSFAVIGALSACVLVLGPFFYFEGTSGLLKIAEKVFPLRRRIFEDKVSSFWCVLHNLVKVNYWPLDLQVQLCLAVTVLALIPGMVLLSRNPSKKQFILSLVYSSMCFFLFSMQVHEKHITMVQLFLLLAIGFLPQIAQEILLVMAFSMF